MLRQGDTGDWVGTFEGHKGAVWGVALNADATLAASGAADFSARVWNAVSGEEKVSFQHKHIVKSVSFDGPCERLVTGSNEKLIRVFSLQQPTSDPDLFPGHGGSIKRAVFFRNDRCIVSCAEDKTMRVWDRSSGAEVQRIDFATTPNSLELSADQSMLTVAHGTSVSFFDADTLGWQKEVKVGTLVAAASLHPDKHMFVCGGEDFKMYKFDYANGNEIGRWSSHVCEGVLTLSPFPTIAESYKGHFGPVHTVGFSPDGELYASGSEDGTLRLWQTTVGKTYGLFKCTDQTAGDATNGIASAAPREVQAS